MILIIDNYDSFTYNLFQYFSELDAELMVVRNDKITLEEIEAVSPRIAYMTTWSFASSVTSCRLSFSNFFRILWRLRFER